MAYSPQAAQAIVGLAKRMGVDPGALAGLIELESSGDPNVWGGAGKQYRGLIQFGPGARKEVGLPDKPMTVEEQIPFVEKYFQSRGFTPGKHGVKEMYRTVLVGNPYQGGTDSFGTNSDAAAKRMLPGGDLYQRGMAKLQSGLNGAVPAGSSVGFGSSQLTTPATSQTVASDSTDPLTKMALAIAGGGRSTSELPDGLGTQRFAAEEPLAVALAQLMPETPKQTQQIVAALEPAQSGSGSHEQSAIGRSAAYIQGGWGPGGPNHYGPHFDIKGTDNSYFPRDALDPYVQVNGKPLSSGLTVAGGEFGASRDGGRRKHTGWDYAFGGDAALSLAGGAQWLGSTPTSYGDAAQFRLPDGRTFKILHGKLSRT